jgi:hypothetical protein
MLQDALLTPGTNFARLRCSLGAPWSLTTTDPEPRSRTPPFLWKSTMKTVGFEVNREARQALTLSVAGVMAIMLVWNLAMLLLH